MQFRSRIKGSAASAVLQLTLSKAVSQADDAQTPSERLCVTVTAGEPAAC